MIVIVRDAVMPDCCNTCVCSEGYGCGITDTIMTTKEMESRPDWCPLEEVEPCEDTISRKAAIDALGDEPEVWTGKDEYAMGLNNQWHYDRNAIKAVPCAQPETEERTLTEDDYAYCMNCDHGEMCRWYPMYGCEFKSRPSAQPERKTGKWVRHYSRPNVYADLCWHCSNCGYKTPDNWANKWKFCPNCGARMVQEGEEP